MEILSIQFLHGASDRSRTGTGFDSRRILSPVRLPIPPLRPIKCNGGANRIRTDDKGVAVPCLTTWLWRR